MYIILSLVLDVQKMDQSLVWKGFFWDLGFDQHTVQVSGKRKVSFKGEMGFYSCPGNGICQNLSMGFGLFHFVFCLYMYVRNLGNHLFKWEM